MPGELLTFIEAAEQLGTDRFTVAGLVRALNIERKQMRGYGKGRARGLDARDMARLARALGLEPGKQATPA